jgi:hypothetical protein
VIAQDVQSQLWERERGFWTGGTEYYARHLSADVMIVFPGVVLDRRAVIEAVSAAPRWTTVTFAKQRALVLSDDVVLFNYHATAHRETPPSPFHTLVTSVYVRRAGAWLLAFQRQTT